MQTTIVCPADPELGAALRVASAFAAFTVLLHVLLTLIGRYQGYGYFRDEFYYLICGRHLAWGYVDHGPLVAIQARLAETLFGRSLVGLRMFAALGGGACVFLTGLIGWALGGRRSAQVLGMIGLIVAPQYLGGDSYLSMNSIESLFWMTSLLAVILIERGGPQWLWLLFGLSAGLGLLNKPSMTFFLIALLIAMLLTPQRRLLATPWMLAGVALMLAIVAPNILWQIHNHWPTLEFLENGRAKHKNVTLGPLAFLNAQFIGMHPLNLLIWLPGLVWLLRRERRRWLGLTFLIFLAIMMALHAKDYYVVPIYPVLFAAGGLAWESRQRTSATLYDPHRLFGFPILESVLVLTGILLLPMSNPVLTPPQWLAYAGALHLRNKTSRTENMATGPLPQFYADRFGWQEEVDQVQRAADALPPDQRKQLVILCSNYGEASAINFLGRNLPTAVSGQNNYFLWGPGPLPGEVAIIIERNPPSHYAEYYDTLQIVGHMGTPWSMPFEHRNIYLVRGRHQDIQSFWPSEKDYF